MKMTPYTVGSVMGLSSGTTPQRRRIVTRVFVNVGCARVQRSSADHATVGTAHRPDSVHPEAFVHPRGEDVCVLLVASGQSVEELASLLRLVAPEFMKMCVFPTLQT